MHGQENEKFEDLGKGGYHTACCGWVLIPGVNPGKAYRMVVGDQAEFAFPMGIPAF